MMPTRSFQPAHLLALLAGVFTVASLHAQIPTDPQKNGSQYLYPVRTWEQQERPRLPTPDEEQNERIAITATNRKLQQIILPEIRFRQIRLADAIEYLHQESVRLDSTSTPLERGVNISVPPPARVKHYRDDNPYVEVQPQPQVPVVPRSRYLDSTLSLHLDRTPLLEAIAYTAQAVNLKMRVTGNAVYLESCNIENQPTYLREYRVPPEYSLLKFVSRDIVRAILEATGITYPDGASAVYRFDKDRLVVRNTTDNLDIIDLMFAEAPLPVSLIPTPAPNP